MIRGAGWLAVSLVVSAVSLGVVDATRAVSNWEHLAPLGPGRPLAGFEVRDLEGRAVTIDSLVGRPAVVTLWASWCPACRTELPRLDRLRAASDPARVRFLAVNAEGPGLDEAQRREIVRGVWSERGFELPAAIDGAGTLSGVLRARALPHTVVLDGEGRIRHVHQGLVSESTLRDEVEALMASTQ